jgi:hypothetical protein
LSTVQIPRGLLVTLVVVLVLVVLVLVFLMGRESASVAPTTIASQPPPLAGASARPQETLLAAPADTFPDASPAAIAPVAPTLLPMPTASVEASGADRAELARYFSESETIQARAKYWSDPQALAKTILEQAASGNTSAFDELIRAQRQARTEMERLTTPAACDEYQRRSLAVMDEGIALLERVQGAVSSGDLGGLDALTSKGRELEAEARAIDELGRTIRQRVGL